MELNEWLVKKLPRAPAETGVWEGYLPSAVLVPLFRKRGKFHLLYTLRSQTVRDHKGQISFPGGCREAGDPHLLETALRETEEEIGLKRPAVRILGNLGGIFTPTRYHITPFVGLIEYPYTFRFNRDEIDCLIEVPLTHLLQPKNFRSERAEFFDPRFDYPFFFYRGHTIWGATGRITRELVEIVRKFPRGNP